ncbi:hypothetical protein Glove_18g127 [Diversispora epigaea]|uniref:Uncharacterized protein n=1 Tax=Diversispora epigaea TaxID=1348612 RepID=A0A397JP94_9GLOM|nr:hypothetical protein Glove_18g127 [Diversispora epigaea]
MDKVLTPEYLDWHAKLVDSSSRLTDKIRLSLYRAYMEETGLDPWMDSKLSEKDFICTANQDPAPLCNKNHKKENIRNHIEGFWGSGEYCGEKAYRLYCYIRIQSI